MKNPQETSSLITYKDQIQILKSIRALLKSKSSRPQAVEMLENISSGSLSKYGKVLFHYLWGMVHLLEYKKTNDIDDLETANDFFDDMVVIAFEKKVQVTDPKMHFARAYAKFRLAQMTWEDERKPWLLQKANHITATLLKFHPKDSRFLWLKSQLA